jgi:hypothetical protein
MVPRFSARSVVGTNALRWTSTKKNSEKRLQNKDKEELKTEILPDGSFWTGKRNDGNGFGKLVSLDGTIREGEFKNYIISKGTTKDGPNIAKGTFDSLGRFAEGIYRRPFSTFEGRLRNILSILRPVVR